MRCDTCGRFTASLHDVWCNPYTNGIDRSICGRCWAALREGGR